MSTTSHLALRMKAGTVAAALTAGLLTAGAWSVDVPSARAAGADRPLVNTADVKGWKVPRLAVMPLGDSITFGTGSADSGGTGYRGDLWKRLGGHADSLDFVGSRRDGKLPGVDLDHEGHYGWRISDLSSCVETWLSMAKPNVVLLHIGTNDMGSNDRVDGAPARLGALIDKITTAAPDMTVLVASLVPSADPTVQKRVEAFNAAVPKLVAARQAKGRHVGFVGMDAVTTRDLSDGTHPNASGYAKMAEAFSSGLARAAADGWIRPHVDIKPAKVWGDYAVDINGDRKADYLVVEPDGSARAWINERGTGRGTWSDPLPFASGVGEPGERVRFADINGDGLVDYLVVHDDGVVKAWVNNGRSGPGRWDEFGTFATGVDEAGGRVRFADVNGDRKADYLVVKDDGSVRAWINKGGTGNGGWSDPVAFASGVGESAEKVRFADINGDGKADYLVVQDDGSVRAWTNDGEPGSGKWTEVADFASSVGESGDKVRFADVDGDGRADYLVLQDDGVMKAWINNGLNASQRWTEAGTYATGVGEPGSKVRI
ncbi:MULTISPECIES: FG-GAP-like repeat-containing protein [Streptomyces]|uniref:FG-GAP-like repeat-containing protein n=1 Tax=Streptomyces TaxID=1883 RepID=UPI0031E46DB2